MIEVLIVIMVVGFLTYYLIRHPIKSLKITGKILAIFLLGILAIIVFIVFIFGALTLLAAL